MSIQVLSGEVIDQIAAGEVVERPAHMVKELVENSLDAGATRVEIDYSQGGRWVQVKDDGAGIAPAELPLALSRHATSKISASEDLWNLHSYGFRGEALASISAVCRLQLMSRTEGAERASQLFCEFGKVSGVEEVGGEKGTRIHIEELFTNTPARLKFLKSEAAEGVQIKNVVRALALSHPQVEFRLNQKGKLIFFWPKAESRLERAKQVLEIDNLYEGEAVKEGSRAYAVFTDPNTTTKTSKNIWLFSQNRWIQDRSLQTAIQEAYRNLLMHGEFPTAVVWLENDPAEVDVNIHPTKSRVKLRDSQSAFRAVRNAIKGTLEKAPWLEKILASPSTAYESFRLQSEGSVEPSNFKFNDPTFEKTQFSKRGHEPFREKVDSSSLSSFAELKDLAEQRDEQFQSSGLEVPAPKAKWADLEILGQANLTYIVTQRRDALVVVDMHAAHERVKFESLMEAWRGGKIEVQEFLFPISFDFSEEKVEALLRVVPDLEKLGLYLEGLGPATVGVKAAPTIISEKAIGVEIEKLAHELTEYGEGFSFDRKIGDICATMACHSAVRAGQSLSQEQMRALLEEMDQYPLSSFCPHGRPVYVEYPFSRLERDFGRIV